MNLCDLICFRVFSVRGSVHVLKWSVLSVMVFHIPFTVFRLSSTDLQLIASNCEQAICRSSTPDDDDDDDDGPGS